MTLPTKVRLVKAMVFPVVMYGCKRWTVKKAECRRIDAFELWCWRRLSWESLDCKEIQPVHRKGDQPWDFFGRNDAKAETPVLLPRHAKSWTHWKRLWCWEGLGAGGEGDDRGWDGWMASPTRWTWVWVKSRSWWWTGRPGTLWFIGLQRVGHNWATELSNSKENQVLYKHLMKVKRRQWHPIPVLLSRKSHGWRSLVGCSPWGRTESHTTEMT